MVLSETLKKTRLGLPATLSDIAQSTQSTKQSVEAIISEFVQIVNDRVIPQDNSRFRMAIAAVGFGGIRRIAEAMTWQEFEAFGLACLDSAGFQTWKGLIVKDRNRRWQIDLTGKRESMILSIDCKHWDSPSYTSKLSKAAEHQRLALPALVRHVTSKLGFKNYSLWVLPVVLTLLDPRFRTLDGAALVSVEQLSDFLEHVTPYDSELPFVSTDDLGESSISQPPLDVLGSD